MSPEETTNKIKLAKAGHIPIHFSRLFEGSNNTPFESDESALLDALVVSWATLLNTKLVGDANELATMGRGIFGDRMEKAMIACVETTNGAERDADKAMGLGGDRKIGGVSGKDTAVVKLAGLFWLLVGTKRMGQAEKTREMGERVQREGGVQFEEMVDIIGKAIVE